MVCRDIVYCLCVCVFCVGHAMNDIDELWQQVSRRDVVRTGRNLARLFIYFITPEGSSIKYKHKTHRTHTKTYSTENKTKYTRFRHELSS